MWLVTDPLDEAAQGKGDPTVEPVQETGTSMREQVNLCHSAQVTPMHSRHVDPVEDDRASRVQHPTPMAPDQQRTHDEEPRIREGEWARRPGNSNPAELRVRRQITSPSHYGDAVPILEQTPYHLADYQFHSTDAADVVRDEGYCHRQLTGESHRIPSFGVTDLQYQLLVTTHRNGDDNRGLSNEPSIELKVLCDKSCWARPVDSAIQAHLHLPGTY